MNNKKKNDEACFELLSSEAYKALTPHFALLFHTLVDVERGIESALAKLTSGNNPAEAAIVLKSTLEQAKTIDLYSFVRNLLAAQETTSSREEAFVATPQEKSILINKVLQYLQNHDGDEMTWGYIYAAYHAINFEERREEIEAEIKAAKKLDKDYSYTEWGILPKSKEAR